MNARFTSARAGFSIVLTLIILTLLAILVVGFLSSTAMDRATAHAFADKAQAETAAGTAVNQAMSMLRESIAQYPNSATVWEKLTPSGGGPDVEGTMLYYDDLPPPNGLDPASGVTPPKRYILPLLSRGLDANGVPPGPVEVKDKAKALGTETWHEAFWKESKGEKTSREPDCVDLNRPRSNEDKAGWIGAAPDGRKPYYAKWIEVKENGDPKGRTISRYAFWVEDESFKMNLNLLGTAPRESEKDSLDAEMLKNRISELPIQGLLRSAKMPAGLDLDTVARNAEKLRDSFYGKRLMDLRSFNQLAASYASKPYQLGDETKFLATVFSGGLNVSRHGSQRLNLNALGFGIEPEKNDPTDVQTQLYEIIETIRYHAPKFGERFYRAPEESDPALEAARRNAEVVKPSDENIYLHKVAANIRDYIDLDFKPTIVQAPNPPSAASNSHGKLWPQGAPITAMSADEGDNAAWAQGKDSAPFLQEAVARFRGGPTTPGLAPTSWTLTIDYYLEFWNMTDEDIPASKLGPNPFVRISNQVGWREQLSSGTGSPLKSTSPPLDPMTDDRLNATYPYIIYLTTPTGGPPIYLGDPNRPNAVTVKEVTFKKGTCTVITSDPDLASLPGGVNLDTTYCSTRVASTTRREFFGNFQSARAIGIIQMLNRDTVNSDYGTEVILGSDEGYLESHPFAVAMQNVTGLKNPSVPEKTYGGSLFGNSGDTTTPSQLGDPRTNNEQLVIRRFMNTTDPNPAQPDQTRYFNTAVSARTLGWPNTYVNPQNIPQWKDYYKGWENPPKPSDVLFDPAHIANGRLVSIGQLGDVFDPSRVNGTVGTLKDSPTQYLCSRGGGRTFKIGQADDLVDSTSATAASRRWASWRLCDFLSDSSDLQLPGVININGIARDNGAALRAAFYGMTVDGTARGPAKNSPVRNATNRPFNSEEKAAVGLQNLITAALERMGRNDPAKADYDSSKPYFGPFMERGEFSELETYAKGNGLLTDDFDATIDMSHAFDRTRETVFRRLVDFTTTRGSIFSVYAIGQSITEGPPPLRQKRVTGTHQVKVTFELVPRKANGDDFGVPIQSFPTTPTGIKERFAAPHHYDIRILQVSS